MRTALTGVALIGTMACAAPSLAGGATFKLLETFDTYDVTVDQVGRTLVVTGGTQFGGYGDYFIYEVDADAYTYIAGPAWANRISADGTTVVGSTQAVDVWVEAVKWTVGGG